MFRCLKKALMLTLVIVIAMPVGTGILYFITDSADATVIAEPSFQRIPISLAGDFYSTLDSQGYVHILYSRGWLDYITNSKGSFDRYSVSDDLVGMGSLAIDSKNNVHLVYAINDLVYSTFVDEQWKNETVINGREDAQNPITSQLVMDSRNNPHIIYYDMSNLEYVYAQNTSGSWKMETMVQGDNNWSNFHITIDSNNRIHIICLDDSNGDLVYVTNSDGSWNAHVIDGGNISVPTIYSIMDSEDHLHLSYKINNELKYATCINASWSIETIAGFITGSSSMALDSHNRATIVYSDDMEGLVYVKEVGSSWQFSPTGEPDAKNYATYFVLDSKDRAHIFFIKYNSQFMYATNMEGNWSIQELTALNTSISDQYQAWIESVFIDFQDRIHIVYRTSIMSPGVEAFYATFKPVSLSSPGPPTYLTATPSDSQVLLNWAAPANDGGSAITGYNISWSLTLDGPFTSTVVNGTSYLHEGLENGQTYYYYVAAINALGESNKTEVVSAIPIATIKLPIAPTNLVASVNNGNVSLTWTTPTDGGQISGYKIYRGTSSETIGMLTSISGTSFLDANVSSNQTYYYQVSAVNAAGEGERSVEVNVTVPANNEPAPDPSPPFYDTLGGQVAIVGLIVVAGVGAVTYALWRRRRP